MKNILVMLSCFVCALYGCRKPETLFSLIPGSESGIDFNNLLIETDTMNALTFEYMYNGGGVAVNDFNNDGLVDIFFTGNQTSSRIYLNKGNFKFEDVTAKAGVNTSLWCTGVAVADVNGDGLTDLYISTIDPKMDKRVPNILFINQGVNADGVPAFKNLAADFGLADSSYSTQATFVDYDLDGDLDLYLLTNSIEHYTRNATIGQRYDGTGKSVDKLYRNDGVSGQPTRFTDVSAQAGILGEGWGLGIIANDFNGDGWPDIYCANDFLSSDHLYINQRDGTFRDQIAEYMNHQEFNGMGADMADLDNDGFNDLVVVDMMPEDNLRQKAMFSGMGYDRFMKSLAMKYQPQYIRNVLQRNNGDGTFSDVGYQSGIYATDWSWAPLIADFDNDGLRDILITNGYPKDITDLDFVLYSKDASRFGTEELKRKNTMKAIRDLKGVFKPNVIFQNKGDLRFEDKAAEWGLSKPCYSNGAAYADFDNDGDLDIVINNLNGDAHLYKNNSKASFNFLTVDLKGPVGNSEGIGAKWWVYADKDIRYGEQELQRGYMSSVDPRVHIGLGNTQQIDSLVVVWPGNKKQVLTNLKVNEPISLSYSDANIDYVAPKATQKLLVKETLPTLIQKEDAFVDYKFGQATLPHKFSQAGPAVAVGDLDGDGVEDFVIGGTAGHPAKICIQKRGGQFAVDSLPNHGFEDGGVLLFDADNDHDLDLYAVSGSSEFGRESEKYQDRLYLNDGAAKFTLSSDALPKIVSSGSCVVSEDVDQDGDLDLFVGGRIVPMSYPMTPKSYLLLNDGAGKFADATAQFAPGLDSAGMVTSALFTDYDNDGWKDLIVVGEWMPITFFHNTKGALSKANEMNTGWWNSIAGGDFDNDGDIDYVAGNLGHNSVLQASEDQPVSIYAKDFDKNGSVDPFMSRYIAGVERPVHYRETMTEQTPMLRKILTSYAGYGNKTMKDILDFLGSDGTVVKRVTHFASCYVENRGDGSFFVRELPRVAQASPIHGIVITDLNDDSFLDFLAVGNSFAEETLSGFYDAGTGLYALGRGDGTFDMVGPAKSGFSVRSDAKGLAQIVIDNERSWIVTSNSAPVRLFKGAYGFSGAHVRKVGASENGRRKVEYYYGSGYLSQSGRSSDEEIRVYDPITQRR